MEKKEGITGMYETTFSSGVFVGKLSAPTKMSLTEETKVALLEYLTESDEFHKLVCDITGVERKQVKVSPELEKLKEDYLHVCNRYKHEQQKSNDLLHEWRKETARRMDAERERDNAEKASRKTENIYNSELQRINKCNKNQAKTITKQMNDILSLRNELAEQKELVKKHMAKSEKLQSKLDKASKRYGELIKTISDRAIKSI